MARRPPELRAVHRAEDRIGPRMARAVRRSAERLRRRLPMDRLEDALASGDVRQVDALLDEVDWADAYEPGAAIIRDAFVRGGRIGVEDL